jgi:hypothetical protein
MMKTSKIFLHRWLVGSRDGYIDIPWPQIHRAVGADLINWVKSKDLTKVQLVVEQTKEGGMGLYADFYCDDLRTEFALRFAK